MKENIVKAREAYLADHPFDPSQELKIGRDDDGKIIWFDTNKEFAALTLKFGTEYLGHVRSIDDCWEWVKELSKYAPSGEALELAFFQIFMELSHVLDDLMPLFPFLDETLETFALKVWEAELVHE